MMSQNIENVVKQGYLKKGHFGANRLSVLFRRNDVNKWFVFTIRRGVPFLEYYDSDVDVFTQQPINSFNLSRCQNVRSMGNTNPPSFCIVCPDRIIELVASSRAQMVEWVHEVEASLVRLGILKNEVVDHVYSVCPAVVRKPRVSLEATDENQSGVSSLQSSGAVADSTELRRPIEVPPQVASSTDSLPPPPPRSSALQQRTSSFKPPPRAPLANRSSSSFHASRHPAPVGVDTPAPPVPARLSSCTDKTSNRAEPVERTLSDQAEKILPHPATDGSNDSDFVSPEVIAELRLHREASKKKLNLHNFNSENKPESTSGTLPESSSDIYVDMSGSNTERSIDVHCSSSPSQQAHFMALALQPQQVCTEAYDSNHDSAAYMTPQCADCLDVFPRPDEVVENTYSSFPCQEEAPDEVIDSTDPCGSHTPKPIAAPRKIVPRIFSVTCDVPSKTLATADEEAHEAVAESSNKWSVVEDLYKNLAPADDTYGNVHVADDCKNVVSGDAGTTVLDAGNCTREYTSLKHESEYNNVLHAEDTDDHAGQSHSHLPPDKDKDDTTGQGHSHLPSVKDDHSGGHSHLPLVKDNDSHPSKDENENFYGLLFDPEPPTTRAPPIPPLPSGHYLQPARCYMNQSTTGQETGAASSSVSANNTAVPTAAVQSAFHAAASHKHTGLPSDSIPPLPLRRKTTNSHSFHSSLLGSVATGIESRDIHHRAGDLQHTLSLDDHPPALPSRGSHSFFIKRPQITGISGNKMSSSEGSNTSLKSQEPALSTDSTCPQTETATSVSHLSRKMLLDRAHSLHTVVSLKQTQAEILQTEISLPSVTVTITQKAGHGIALVDWNSYSCVVGWNQKDFPSLHGKLHLGDLISSINNVRVTSAEAAQKMLKQALSANLELMLHRMPYAKVFAIHRNAEGQSLGIKRNGGTGEIIYVDPNGLAAQHGLTPYAQSVCGAGRCNWFLVEINNRPLSLFFKDDEIDHRLSAVGRDISLVVQPSDFIYEIRRQFKKLRNYKLYLTQ